MFHALQFALLMGKGVVVVVVVAVRNGSINVRNNPFFLIGFDLSFVSRVCARVFRCRIVHRGGESWW